MSQASTPPANQRCNNSAQGKEFEEQAARYLSEKGYRIVKRNFRFGKVGEIDIICADNTTLVFVEVKARKTKSFGTPEQAITPSKKAQLRRVAKAYLYVCGILDVECRFDVIAIDESESPAQLRHLINAFW